MKKLTNRAERQERYNKLVQLLSALPLHDLLALDQPFLTLLPKLQKIAYATIRRATRDLPDDLVHDLVLELLDQCRRTLLLPNPPNDLGAWLGTVARRAAWHLARKEGTYPKGLIETDGEPVDGYLEMPATLYTPADASEAAERALFLLQIEAAFVRAAQRRAQLNDQDGMLIELVYVHGKTSKEAGDELGRSSVAVRQRWGRDILPYLIEDVRLQLMECKSCAEFFGELLRDRDRFHEQFKVMLKLKLELNKQDSTRKQRVRRNRAFTP